ncbi:hypothetical protein CLV37_13515 [Kineococcus rhizosphaerae]|uniref:Uncharacterized protein n=1 Tax=Kineococcus rhizosphaerae TaxID=559628 RepID=A0A2T0QNC0_9ACTN|nr:hypothetical protein CLV37_13515 [Kineococcus rhizosphaerae]
MVCALRCDGLRGLPVSVLNLSESPLLDEFGF